MTGLQIRIFAEAERAAGIAEAVADCMSAVASHLADQSVTYDVKALRWVCDSCGRDRPVEHSDWVHTRDHHDYCPECIT